MWGKNIKDRILIVTGYIVGLNCLFLISYRTLIAFFSESKAITIYINRFGEQFIDIFAIIIIWIICLIGLIFLIGLLKKEESSKQLSYEFNLNSLIDQNKTFYDLKNDINGDIKNCKIIDNLKVSSNDILEKLKEQFKNN